LAPGAAAKLQTGIFIDTATKEVRLGVIHVSTVFWV